MTNIFRQRCNYVLSDMVLTMIAFVVFSVIRFHFIERYLPAQYSTLWPFMKTPAVVAEIFLVPVLLVLVSWLTGFYNSVFYKSRLQVISNTIIVSFICMLVVFLLALLNDVLPRRRLNYELMFILFGLLTGIVVIGRLIISNIDARAIRRGERSIKTVLIGASAEAAKLKRRIDKARKYMGLHIVACVDLNEGPADYKIDVPMITLDEVPQYCADNDISALVLSPKTRDNNVLITLANRLLPLNKRLYISPDLYNPISARPVFNNVAGEPLIDISRPKMSAATLNFKRLCDVILSILALIILSPFLLIIAIIVKLDSKGPVFYRQERLGYHRKPFRIVKFRSMFVEAEKDGTPKLSKPHDKRITRFGSIMRKFRIDELPNFWNVLCGDMSLVGPRPERDFFVKQILVKAPVYALLYSVRPGITSWGAVKFGYAQNVDEMIERMRYDLLYIDNVSLTTDLKILFYTVRTVITGQGL